MQNPKDILYSRTRPGSEAHCEFAVAQIRTCLTGPQLNGGLEEQLPPPLLSLYVLVLSTSVENLITPNVVFVAMFKFTTLSPPLASFDLVTNAAPAAKFVTIPNINSPLPNELYHNPYPC